MQIACRDGFFPGRQYAYRKGGIYISAIGYIQARAYASAAQLPLRDVAVTITDEDGMAIAMRLTDRNGVISPVQIPVPDRFESQEPDAEERPYSLVNLAAHHKGYEMIEAKHLQVFAGTVTYQELEMIPISERSVAEEDTIFYNTPSQDL